jgi:hypothetical protein
LSGRRRRTLQERVDQRRPVLESLVGEFSRYVERFDANRQFGGPSIHFHRKAIEALSRHPTAVDALGDDTFFDYLYATLASWGLHGMGPGNARLGLLGQLKASFRQQASSIERVQHLQIDQLDPSSAGDVAEQAWAIIAGLRVAILTSATAGSTGHAGPCGSVGTMIHITR